MEHPKIIYFLVLQKFVGRHPRFQDIRSNNRKTKPISSVLLDQQIFFSLFYGLPFLESTILLSKATLLSTSTMKQPYDQCNAQFKSSYARLEQFYTFNLAKARSDTSVIMPAISAKPSRSAMVAVSSMTDLRYRYYMIIRANRIFFIAHLAIWLAF